MYGALHELGLSNREIAVKLGVNEASVRRGLKKYAPRPRGQQFLVTITPVA